MIAARIRKCAADAARFKRILKEGDRPDAFDLRMLETRLHELANAVEQGVWEGEE